MRSYPIDSPEAAARIVALTMLADGHLSQCELDVMQHHQGCEQLGLSPERLHEVVRALCEDLLKRGDLAWTDVCQVDEHALSRVMSEISERGLQERVLALCLRVAEADAHVCDGESLLLTQAVEQWGLHAVMLTPGTPLARGPGLACSQ